MRIASLSNQVSFKYKNVLKTEWIKGNMPSVKYDMGGNLLTKDNISLGHMQAHSLGGKTVIDNLMLETKKYNNSKGNLPFSQFFNREAFEAYCKQFENIKLPNLNGWDYILRITKTAEYLIRNGK